MFRAHAVCLRDRRDLRDRLLRGHERPAEYRRDRGQLREHRAQHDRGGGIDQEDGALVPALQSVERCASRCSRSRRSTRRFAVSRP